MFGIGAERFGGHQPPRGNAKTVAVVDDDASLRLSLCRSLEGAGFGAIEAADGASILKRLRTREQIDLVALDLNLDHEDGLLLADDIRAIRKVPIIIMTGRSHPRDRVAGFDHGADDYITKPFHFREIAFRIHQVLRRYELEALAREAPGDDEGESGAVLVFAGGSLDQRRRILVSPDGATVPLTTAEFRILSILMTQPGHVVSRDEIMLKLKGRKWSPMERTIDTVIARLRRKLEPSIEAPTFIRTVWGRGYVFADTVIALDEDGQAPAAAPGPAASG